MANMILEVDVHSVKVVTIATKWKVKQLAHPDMRLYQLVLLVVVNACIYVHHLLELDVASQGY